MRLLYLATLAMLAVACGGHATPDETTDAATSDDGEVTIDAAAICIPCNLGQNCATPPTCAPLML